MQQNYTSADTYVFFDVPSSGKCPIGHQEVIKSVNIAIWVWFVAKLPQFTKNICIMTHLLLMVPRHIPWVTGIGVIL